jgi:NAD(P)-dependent dehydrogenase (short-subunit alcohol dehydrogenase family)
MLPGTAELGRVVLTSSGTHDPATLEGRFNPPYPVVADVLARQTPGRACRLAHLRRYSTSKLCNLLFAYELDRRLRAAGRGITCNAFDTGVVPATGLPRDSGRMLRALVAGPLLLWSGVRVETPEAAGAALARLVLDPALGRIGGRYFAGLREVQSSPVSRDDALAAALWRDSARLCSVTEPAV